MDRKVLNRTHFRRRHTEAAGWQWHWTTKANNNETTAVGGEGYDQLRGAVNGFFSTHGVDPEAASLSSEFSQLEKFSDDHYVITQYQSAQ